MWGAGNKPWLASMACRATALLFGTKNEQIPTPVVKNIHLYLHTRRTIQQNTHTNGWMVLGILFLTKSNLWVFFLPATTKSLVRTFTG